MADLNFPLNPQVNDIYTFNGRSYKYDGSKWRFVTLSLTTITTGTAITSINSLTNSAQNFFVGVSGSGFNISSVGSSHTFNIPFAGSASTGLITTASQTIAGSKTFSSDLVVSSSTASTNTTSGAITVTGGAAFGNSINVAGRINLWNSNNYTSFVSSASGNTVYTLPATSPATGSSVLQSTSDGVMSWVPMTATSGSSGSATTANNVNLVSASTNTSHPVIFSPSSSGSGVALSSNTTLSFNPSTNILSVSGLAVTAGTSSTSTSTGALIVSGGAAIGGTLFVGTTISVNSGTSGLLLQKLVGGNYGAIYSSGVSPSATNYTMITDGAAVNFNGTTGVYFNISNTNKIQVTTNNINIVPTAASTSTSTGAFTVAGGVGIGGSLYVASATAISGITINAGIITGSLTGTATTASNINVVNATTNSAHPLHFSPLATGSGLATSSNTTLSYNPSTLVLSTSGLAITAGTASTNFSTGALVVTGGVGIGGSLFVNGDLTINGTTTTINSVTLTVDDKNIELGSVTSPSDVTAEGGGITLKGATDKSINWYTGTGWSSSESWNLVSGNTYKINNTTVLSNSSLGTGITNSSLTALGTITTGVWAGTLITSFYGGTGYNSYTKGDLLVGAGNTFVKLSAGNDLTILTADSNAGSGLSWKGLLAPTYGAFGSTAVQQVTAANTETLVTYNLTYEANKVSIGSGTTTRVYINDSGTFNIAFSAQVSLASGNQPKTVDVWFKIDGVNVPQSNSRQTIVGKDNETILSLNFVSTFISGQYVELAFSSADANIQFGTFTGLTSPTRPDIPSMILTVVPVSSILPGSGLAITGLASLNLLTANAQTLVTGTSGVDFNINSTGSVHTFNIPNASASARGLISTTTQTIGGNKTFANDVVMNSNTVSTSSATGTLTVIGGVGIGGSLYVSSATGISGVSINNGVVTGSLTGTATTATNLNVVLATTNASHPVLFTPTSGSASGLAVSSNTTLVYNPSTDILSVSGMAVTSGTASTTTTTGSFVATGGVGIGQSVSIGGRLQLFNGANYTAFVSSASGNTVYTLPATSPATGSSVLQSTSAGVLSWVAMTATGTTISNIVINSAGNANAFHPILFTPSSLSAGSAVSSDSTITFNPSTEILNVSGLAVTSGTASTNTTTGALVVRGGLGVSGQLSFAQASFGFTGITTNPTMSFIGATSASPITLTVLTDNSLNFEGSQGSVFSIDSNLSSGEIFSVSDISGLPIISASAGQTVNINEFGGYTQIGNGSINSSSTTTGSLVIAGGLGLTGNAFIGGTVFISNTTVPSYGSTTSGALVVSGGVGIGGSVYIGGQLGVGGTLDYNASGNVSYFAGNVNSYNQVIVHNHNTGSSASSDFIVSNDSTTDTTFFGDFGMNSSGWAATTSAYNTANAVYLVSNSGDLAIGTLTTNPIRFIYNNGLSDAVIFGGIAATVNYGTNSSSTTSGALQVKGGLGITGNAFIGGTTTVSSTTASTSSSTGALTVSGGVGIGLSASIGGRLQLFNGANYTALVSSATGNTVYTLPDTSPATGTSVLVSTSSGVWSWVAPSSVGNSSGGTTNGTVQYKSGSGFAGTSSFLYDTLLYGLTLSNFPGGETPSSTSAALKVEQTTGSFNGSVNGTMIAVNANSGFTGDLLTLQTNANTKFTVSAAGAIGTSSNITTLSTTAATNTTSGALQVRGGAGIAQTLFVGGSISNANYFYSGGNNFTKSGQAQGDILLDNNANDTPGVLYYYKNNTNFGTDVFATGTGSTRYRIVKDLNESGGSELWSIDRSGVVTQTAWAPGEIIKMTVLVGSDLTGSNPTTISTNSDTDVASYSYTPVSSNSYLIIEFTTRYAIAGAAADDFVSRIAVDGAEQSYNVQVWINGAGGGTRSGVLFPLMARYTNSSTSAKTISATVRRGTTDDNATVYKDTTTVMKITEIGR